jgi:hypothetical protein
MLSLNGKICSKPEKVKIKDFLNNYKKISRLHRLHGGSGYEQPYARVAHIPQSVTKNLASGYKADEYPEP